MIVTLSKESWVAAWSVLSAMVWLLRIERISGYVPLRAQTLFILNPRTICRGVAFEDHLKTLGGEVQSVGCQFSVQASFLASSTAPPL